MPTISIARSHSLSHKAAKDAARRVVEDLRKRFDLDYAWNGDEVAFDRPGVRGHMHVGKHEVTLDVQLGLLLGALRSTVEREIHAQLDLLFATPAKATARQAKAPAKPATTTGRTKEAGARAQAAGGNAKGGGSHANAGSGHAEAAGVDAKAAGAHAKQAGGQSNAGSGHAPPATRGGTATTRKTGRARS